MKGRLFIPLRRLRSTRGFTMTETLLGLAVAALLVVGVCSAAVNSSIATRETDAVEFFDNANQNAIAAFQSNAQKSALKNIAPFKDLEMTENADGSVVFTGYYDANLQTLSGETGAAYKIQYTATSKSVQRANFSFSENELKLDIANYERSRSGAWILREHNQNMDGAPASNAATSIRVLALNDDPDATDVTPKDPWIDVVIPDPEPDPDPDPDPGETPEVAPGDKDGYLYNYLICDLTSKRNYWDITKSTMNFVQIGDRVGVEVQARTITKANTPEQDTTKYSISTNFKVSDLRDRLNDKNWDYSRVILHVKYNYVNIQSWLKNNPGSTVMSTLNSTKEYTTYFNGSGPDFAWKTDKSTQIKNLNNIVGSGNKRSVKELLVRYQPQNKPIGETRKGAYAVQLAIPLYNGAKIRNEIYDKLQGPYTVGLYKSQVKDNKQYYRIAIYNKNGENIMASLPNNYYGKDQIVVDNLYFGFGEKDVKDVLSGGIDLYFYVMKDDMTEDGMGKNHFYGAQSAGSWSMDSYHRDKYFDWSSLTLRYTTYVNQYKNMGAKDTQIPINVVTVATRYEKYTFGSLTYSTPPTGGRAYLMLNNLNNVANQWTWWPGFTGQNRFGAVVKNEQLTWAYNQCKDGTKNTTTALMYYGIDINSEKADMGEPQYQAEWKDFMQASGNPLTEAGGRVPKNMELKLAS